MHTSEERDAFRGDSALATWLTRRTVFMLRALEELNVEETAATLGIPEATVRSRYFRAWAMLRAALASEIEGALEEAFQFDGERCDRIVRGVMGGLGTA